MRRRLPAPERVHLNPARRAGTPPGVPWGRVGTDPYLDPGGDIHPSDALEPPARTSSARPRGLLARSRPGAARQSLQVSPTRGHTGRAGGARRLPGRAAASAWPGVAAARAQAPPGTSPPPPAPCGQHAPPSCTHTAGRAIPATVRTARPEDEHTEKTAWHLAHPPRPAPTNQPRQDHCKHPRSHDEQVPFSRRISTVLASNKYRSREQRGAGVGGRPAVRLGGRRGE